jgi:benzoylformate decarboxylase
MAMHAPRGPVFVSAPADDWEAETSAVAAPATPRPPRTDAAALEAVAAALATSAAPAFVVGAEIDEAHAWKTVVRLAERFGACAYASPRSHRASFPESHPLFTGFLPPTRSGVVERLASHDVVLVLGAPAFTYHMPSDGPFLPPGVRLFQITCDPNTAARTPEGVAIVGDVGAALIELLALAPPQVRAAQRPRRTRRKPGPGSPIPVDFLMHTLSRVRPKHSVIVEEAPSSRPAMQAHLPIDTPGGFFTTASGGLGYGLPAAVGIALALPKRRTIALIGDGSSLYAIQALWTAVQFRVPLTVVIVNNGGYEALRSFGELFGIAPVGIDIPGVDFIALARGQGCEAVRVEEPETLEPALRAALAREGPMLIDVHVAPTGAL